MSEYPHLEKISDASDQPTAFNSSNEMAATMLLANRKDDTTDGKKKGLCKKKWSYREAKKKTGDLSDS